MQNLYEVIKDSLFFNKFVINDLICVEYSCPLEEEQLGLFTQSDYIVHVLSGRKTWKTIHGEWTMKAGETLYVRKGAAIIIQDFDEDFCMLAFFLPDDLIRESISDNIHGRTMYKNEQAQPFTAKELILNNYLEGFFQSMLSFFKTRQQPPDSILLLKLKELLLNIISDKENLSLISYFNSLVETSKPSLPHIMESNFCYNLKLAEFAKMCHRSLSSFKRDFHNYYHTSPGKWLLSKRLEYASNLLAQNIANVSQIAFESGFEDVSHFSRAFKQKYNIAPSEYQKVMSESVHS